MADNDVDQLDPTFCSAILGYHHPKKWRNSYLKQQRRKRRKSAK